MAGPFFFRRRKVRGCRGWFAIAKQCVSNLVKSRLVIITIILPLLFLPDLPKPADSHDDDLAGHTGPFDQPLRDSNSILRIKLATFSLGIEKPTKSFLVVGLGLGKLFRSNLKSVVAV